IVQQSDATLADLALCLSLAGHRSFQDTSHDRDISFVRGLLESEILATLGYMPAPTETSRRESQLRDAALATDAGYRSYLCSTFGITQPSRNPAAPWENAVLQRRQDWEAAAQQVFDIGLPAHFQPYKNWDGLAAIDCVLRCANATASILDAGTELYS